MRTPASPLEDLDSPTTARSAAGGARSSKGRSTHAAIVATALDMAARGGLEGLTIGSLAERMRMSKSGVFAHFGSREDLQIAVLKAYERRFVDDVLVPALGARRGLPRLRAIFDRWVQRTTQEAARGCVWISAATEYDDRPGPVRDELVAMIGSWQREFIRAIRQAVDTGDLAPGIDPQDLLFEIYGLILVLHHDGRLLGSPDAVARARRAFERLIDACRAPDKAVFAETHERSAENAGERPKHT